MRVPRLIVPMLGLGCFLAITSQAAWHQHDKLTASDGGGYQRFGSAVAVEGWHAIVGADQDDTHGTYSGAAYFFSRAGAIWEQRYKVTADADAGSYDWFGRSVAMCGDYAIVGAPGYGPYGVSPGAAYIFKYSGGVYWFRQAKLTALDGAPLDHFGGSVAIDGDYAIIGAPYDSDHGYQSGSAYVFKRTGAAWAQVAKLVPLDGASEDVFGYAVGISGNHAAIGAKFDDDKGSNSGSVYIFSRDPTTGLWLEGSKLTSSDGVAGDSFGQAVAIDDDTVIVGAERHDASAPASGAAYIFEKSGSEWPQVAKLTASDGAQPDQLGWSVEISGTYAIAGAFRHAGTGAAYVFEKPSGGWTDLTETAKLTAADGSDEDIFGWSVSIDGKFALIGARDDDAQGLNSGSAYVFRRVMEDDDDIFEHGVAWINDYECCFNDLGTADDVAQELSEGLTDVGWTQKFEKSNAGARATHWSNDEDNQYVDSVDFALFAGHGSKAFDTKYGKRLHSLRFRARAGDFNVTPGNADDSYGDVDAEWLAFVACEVLKDSNGGYWATAFNGAHLILGFSTVAEGDPDFGYDLVEHLIGYEPYKPAKRVLYSWFHAVNDTQPDGTVALVIGESRTMWRDYIWGHGDGPQPDPKVDNTYSYWRHEAGAGIPRSESMPSKLETTSLVLYDVVPKNINESDVADIGALFGMSGTVHYENGMFYLVDGSKYVQVSEYEGLSYGDTRELWTGSEATPNLPSLEDASSAAISFLTTNGLMPPDAAVVPEAQFNDHQGEAEKETGFILQEFPLDIQVSFGREIPGGYPVVGAGSRALVYYGEELTLPIGLFLTWRDIVPAESISIFTESEMLSLLDAHGRKVVLNTLPYYDSISINDVLLGYYEKGFHYNQAQLLPVYILAADFLLDGAISSSGFVYVPAAPELVPPVAEITSPADESTIIMGGKLSLSGSSSYGVPPYTYGWYSDVNGYMGSGSSITYSFFRPCTHTITLMVMDAHGAVGKDMITLTFIPPPGGTERTNHDNPLIPKY